MVKEAILTKVCLWLFCIHPQILLGSSNQGECGGQCTWHA
jgi:hypothetical protein